MKRILAILLTAVLLLSLSGCGKPEPETPELLHPIETANAVCIVSKQYLTSVQCTGGYVVPECVNLSFSYDTSAYQVAVVLGDHVTKGQLLMEFNPELEDTIKRMEIALEREKTEYDYDVEQFNKQIKELKNTAKLLGSSYESKMIKLQIQEMQLNFDRSHAEQAKLIEKDVEELEKKKQELQESKLYSPCDGVVVYQSVYEDGDPIRKDATFLSIAKDDTKQLACSFISRADYDEFTDVKAYIGEKSYDVKYIPYTDEELYKLERTGNEYDTYFTADLDDSVAIGDYVQFVFSKKSKEPVYTVPTAAIVKNGKLDTVMLVRDGFMESREVTVGDSGLNDTEIVSGLSEGDVVYIAKDLARFGAKYETLKPERVVYTEHIGCSGAQKVAREVEPFENIVPGEITEIHIKGIINIVVKEGDPIFTVKANVGRADLEQAKVDLRKYTDTYEEQRELFLDQIEELEKKMKKMKSSSLEYAIAEMDLSDLKEKLQNLDDEANEEITKLNERIQNFTEWDGQEVVIRAKKDCVLSDVSRYRVGTALNEGEILFNTYDLDSYSFQLTSIKQGYRLRYGQKVTVNSMVDGQEHNFDAHVISAPNVRPADASDKAVVYVVLDNPDQYAEAGATGILYYDEYGVIDSLVIDKKLVYHDEKKETETRQTGNQQQGGWQGGNFGDWGGWGQPQQEEYKEAESFKFDSEAYEINKGKPYVWVYDAQGCVVKRYICVMRNIDETCWVVDGLREDDTILVH
ncbi:MAG: hypothetical protein J6Y20_09290 [Lachnospiraceae bacterium]|nr:hypothetical protein [Lachnospiraceae bacterium]